VIDGVMVNKDITHPKMRRRIENPRVLNAGVALDVDFLLSTTNIEGDGSHGVQCEAAHEALADALQIVEEVSTPVDIHDDKAMYSLIQSSIGTPGTFSMRA
jgi:chaperonin GroEL (HSP60 family)